MIFVTKHQISQAKKRKMTSRKRKRMQFKRRTKLLTFEGLEVRRLMVSDWQNPGQAADVNRDLTVSPIDALLGVNRLNSSASRIFTARAAGSTEPYFDVSGDGNHSPLDVLLVINVLNRNLPTVSVELASDTGAGVGASQDRRTTDLSIRGNISRGKASELWGRYSSDTQWHLLKTFSSTTSNQNFTIAHDDLVQAIGGLPNDGLVTLQFQPRFGVGNAEVGSEADLPITFDSTPPQSSFEEQPNFFGPIVMPLATTIEVPLDEPASPSTLVASKINLFDASFSSLSEPANELTPRSVTLSSDGRSLLIEPPTNSQSISYRILIQEGAFEDLAGNLNLSFETLAHRFSNVSQTALNVGQKTDVSVTAPTVKEYTFDLTSPDIFILAGLDANAEMQLDLFSPSGQIVREWTTDQNGDAVGLGPVKWSMLTEIGKYTLRVAAPAAAQVSFKALLSKQLASVPANSQLQGTFTWNESQAFSVNVTNQDRIYFENKLAPQTPFQITLLNQYGQPMQPTDLADGDRVFTVPAPGRYVALIDSNTANQPISFNYTVHLSQTAKQALNLGQFQQATLTIPGQQILYTFAAQAARTYTLDIESEVGDLLLEMPGVFEVNQPGDFAIEASGDGSVLLSLNRPDLPSAAFRFRLTESTTIVVAPVTATVHTEPLQQGLTARTILLEQESYEFTFTGVTGELLAFQENNPDGSASFELIAPTGSVIQPTEQSESFRIYRIPYGGQYRLRAIGDIGAELNFQWQKLSAATVLSANAVIQGNLPQELFVAYRFVANSSRFFVYPTSTTDSLLWKLIDENGRVVEEKDMNEAIATDVTSGRAYTLVVEKLNTAASEQFDFRRRNPLNSTRTGVVGTATTGNLAARGDRVVIELSLTAGQLLDLTSNLDPTLASVRWLDYSVNDSDGPREIDPNVPTLVGATRKYHVEVQNLTDAAVTYSVRFDAIQKPASPPSTLVGFDQIHNGNVDTTPQVFTFDVTAGSYYMFDWLLEENPNLQVEITDPSGNNVNSLSSGTDSALAVIEADGSLTVQISNFADSPQAFSFRMISPSTSETITLGVEKNASVIPFGTAFFNVGLGSPTEVFLQSKIDSENSTGLYRLGSADPFAIAFEGPFINGQFLPGDAFVWASNLTSADYVTKFTAFNVGSLPEAQLNSPLILQTLVDTSYLVPFKTTAANTIIGAAGIAVIDQAGVFLEPTLNGTAFLLKQAGDFRAVFFATDTTTQIQLHTQVEANAAATLATPISGTIADVGDVKRYAITLTAGAPMMLTMTLSDDGFAQWVAPNGEVMSSIVNGSTVLPVYTSGTYQLEIYSGTSNVNYLLELNDLTQSPAVTAGLHSGNTGSGLIEINRLTAAPNQLVELQEDSEQQVQLTAVDRLGKPLQQVSFANRLFSQAPADGIVYILAQSISGSTSVDFSYIVDLVSTQSQAAPIGQTIAGTLTSRLEGKTYTFTVTQPTWLRVSSTTTDSAVIVLKMADGSLRSSPEGFFALVLAGNYEVGIYNDARSPNAFTLNIDLLSQVAAVPLNQTSTINKSGRYRVDIPVTSRFEVQLQSGTNAPLSTDELSFSNVYGGPVFFDPRGTLEAGSYWITFNQASTLPVGDYKLKITQIATTESVLAPGTLGEYTVSATTEQLVTVPMTPGMRLFVDELQLGSGGNVEVRFNSDIIGDWQSVEVLPQILTSITGNETLQFRIRGTGLVRVHVVDLNNATPLTLGSATSVDLDSRRRGQAWLIGGNSGDIVDFINDSSAEQPALWLIVDEAGHIVTKEINQPIHFAIVNRQRLALVVIATEPLTNTVKVPFHTVVS